MNISQLKKAIECTLEEDIPVFVWGKPGVGKSTAIFDIGKEYDVEIRDIRASQIESVDLRGLPSIDNNVTVWHVASFLPSDPESQGILFFDELNAADESVQAAMYQLILDRKLGDYKVPEGWRILAAGNPGDQQITDALSNRFIHLYPEPDVHDWSKWASSNHIHQDIVSFVLSRPELLSANPTNEDDNAFPSPRTWAYASKLYTNHKDKSVFNDLLKGTVGQGAAIEFIGHINLVAQLPTLDELCANPTGYNFVDSPSKQAAMCMLVAYGIDRSNVNELMQYLLTVPKEFQTLVITIINTTKNHLMQTSQITKWCLDNADVFNG